MLKIKPFEEKNWSDIWPIIEPVFRAGETYAFSPDITEKEAYEVWVKTPSETYVALDENNNILGTYYIKPNQPELGSHVCNCGYIVVENARGKGIASKMCKHSQHEAVAKGFRAMQFNLVVSTNEGAIHLWKKLGFDVIGILPKAFRHKKLGFIDALIMYKQVDNEETKKKLANESHILVTSIDFEQLIKDGLLKKSGPTYYVEEMSLLPENVRKQIKSFWKTKKGFRVVFFKKPNQ